MTVGGAAPLGALVLPTVHDIDARVWAFYIANALMAFPLDLMATSRLLVVNRLFAQECALVLVAGLPPLMTAFSELEIDLLFANLYCGILVAQLLSNVRAAREVKGNIRLALGVIVWAPANLLAWMQFAVHEFFAGLGTGQLRFVHVALLLAGMLALVEDDAHSDLAGYPVAVFEALSLERVAAPVMLVVDHHYTRDVRVGRRAGEPVSISLCCRSYCVHVLFHRKLSLNVLIYKSMARIQ